MALRKRTHAETMIPSSAKTTIPPVGHILDPRPPPDYSIRVGDGTYRRPEERDLPTHLLTTVGHLTDLEQEVANVISTHTRLCSRTRDLYYRFSLADTPCSAEVQEVRNAVVLPDLRESYKSLQLDWQSAKGKMLEVVLLVDDVFSRTDGREMGFSILADSTDPDLEILPSVHSQKEKKRFSFGGTLLPRNMLRAFKKIKTSLHIASCNIRHRDAHLFFLTFLLGGSSVQHSMHMHLMLSISGGSKR